jgi:NAD(P)-dependent dehydrogenase (short-subunit alcohol dehydrogenase family)
MRFTDRVVTVTGGAGGIGLAAVKRFGSEGSM